MDYHLFSRFHSAAAWRFRGKMRHPLALMLSVACWGVLSSAHGQSTRTFDTYVIDVEGGEATLFVSPTRESLLVDTGWPGFDGRDADRILAAARHAGIERIDHLVITHYHADHVGGTAGLAARLPIRHFVDRGPKFSEDERAQYDAYFPIRRAGRGTEVEPGDAIPVDGLDVRVIAANGSVLKAPLPGQGAPNPSCADFKPHGAGITSRAADGGDSRSMSLLLTYGRFRTVIMGDLTWNKEFELMCPRNPLGEVDVYLVSHHGADTSGSAALVHALRPRAAVMNNGPRKGGAIQTFQILSGLPGTVDLWQNHYSIPGGEAHNRPDAFIANLDEGQPVPGAADGQAPVHTGPAHWIKVSARADGGFTISNSRTGFAKEYGAR
jgi:beta-lactamase superfamily II metal-dependent hydrolase